VIQTARPDGKMWSVSELQMFEGSRLLLPDGNWRLNAAPNPWDVPLAFDNSPVTRWRSWEGATPGMFIEVKFGEPTLMDQVRLLTTPDAVQTQVNLRGMDARGEWHTLPLQMSTSSLRITDNLRAAAVRALLSRGIGYLLVSPDVFGANDFSENAGAWGIQMVGESGGSHLYRLQTAHSEAAAPEPVPVTEQLAVPPGSYDDPDSRIRLAAAWARDTQFPDAHQHTLTYSNIPAASASLAFTGNTITYVYTRARNRGIAEVFVDGLLMDRVDLYSPDTEWKSKTRYDRLGPGRHVIQIRVTGQRNSHASDCFVDLDALIVE
jgi:hypothetical protein